MLKNICSGTSKILVGFILLSILARILFVFITPIDAWSTDSSNHARFGKEIATFNEIPSYDYYAIDFYNWAPPFFHLVESVFYKIIPSLKLFEVVSSILGISTIPLAYLTFKLFIEKEKAILATFFVSMYPVHIRLSTSIMTDAATLFFTFLVFYALILIERNKKTKYYVLLACSTGLLLLTKHVGFAVLGILIVWVLLTRKHLKKYLFVILVALLIGMPWYMRNYFNTGNLFFWQEVEQVTGQKSGGLSGRFLDLINRITTDKSFLISSIYQYYMRFWDSIEFAEFKFRGIDVPIPFADKLLLFYLAISVPYFVFFILGINLKTYQDRFMFLWLLVYGLFVLYYFTSWGLNFVPRVGIFGLPVFCYLFANGAQKFKKFQFLIIAFLILTGLMYVAFEGFKLYVKNKNEGLFDQSYMWLKENTTRNSLVVSHQWAQISLFSERKSVFVLPNNTTSYDSVYVYDRSKSDLKIGCQTTNCILVYNDTNAEIYKIK